ncbi:hypothetical protein DFJ58DRAFT_110735 [Suillus subalutaceus]|uniref:uncharacterized protein n=1 Tax=Suillus subalutaceus TaxID=48586 RepID=UPI001B8699FB|nr:uncharacterized protein DFJ58DRAFT_110735 [Suillus subalutaceus]KAG1839116.1 hypothetical protein DFJ58DRAFT_110735 [Suillus subalutaceus]
MVALCYSYRLSVVGSVSHSIAIICTIFRLVYRGRMHQLWWEDAWAAFALVADVVCLACIWIDEAISTWILAIAFTSVLWAARMSIIFSIIPVANHSGSKIHKQITRLIAVSFACMWAALLVQKISICKFDSCRLGKSVALSILTTDIAADVSLVAAPLYLLKNVGLLRSRKLLVQCAFCASLLITAVTIPHSILLILGIFNTTTLMVAHIKAALSLTICNLLVIVTFLYRVYSKDTFDHDQSFASNGVFTSIIMAPMGSSTNTMTSFSLQKGITSRQIRVQTRGMKSKDEAKGASVHYAEEGTSIKSS